jgi:hypothetical protein
MRQALARRRQYIALYRAVHSVNSGYSHSAGQRKQRMGLSREIIALAPQTNDHNTNIAATYAVSGDTFP